VINNGWISEIFKNTRGSRQGYPLSALLFVISVEIMALRLRENKNINGIKVKIDEKAHIIKISQLADDTTHNVLVLKASNPILKNQKLLKNLKR
jgi:alanine dehydrogenase